MPICEYVWICPYCGGHGMASAASHLASKEGRKHIKKFHNSSEEPIMEKCK